MPSLTAADTTGTYSAKVASLCRLSVSGNYQEQSVLPGQAQPPSAPYRALGFLGADQGLGPGI